MINSNSHSISRSPQAMVNWQLSYRHLAHSHVWFLSLVALGSLSNLVYTCTLPFVCLGLITGTTLTRRKAIAATSMIWLANQVCGYGLHNYPRTLNSFAWGSVLLMATLAVTQFASYIPLFTQATQMERYLRLCIQFIAGFIGFELIIVLAGFVLENKCVVTVPILWSIFVGNLIWLVGLGLAHAALAIRQYRWTALRG